MRARETSHFPATRRALADSPAGLAYSRVNPPRPLRSRLVPGRGGTSGLVANSSSTEILLARAIHAGVESALSDVHRRALAGMHVVS